MLPEYGTLCILQSTRTVFPFHVNDPYTNTILSKRKKPLTANSILFSVFPAVVSLFH